MLIDEITIQTKAGKGGNGSVSFFPQRQGPCGGDGGNGGSVIVKAKREVKNLNAVAQRKDFIAEDGGAGDSFNKSGRNGKDCILYVPLHTEFTNIQLNRVVVISQYDTEYVLCRGGQGGRGNDRFKSATNQTPRYAEPGKPGEEFEFKVVLKFIADIGLIGLPNAGKSSLLNELTHAQARVAPYPFTTLEPNLGAFGEIILADIPGLIEGASKGKGLGFKFLKHIEKVQLFLHCISCESKNPTEVYRVVRKELLEYNPLLQNKKEVVLLTKVDLITPQESKNLAEKIGKELNLEVFPMSVYDVDALEKLKLLLSKFKYVS